MTMQKQMHTFVFSPFCAVYQNVFFTKMVYSSTPLFSQLKRTISQISHFSLLHRKFFQIVFFLTVDSHLRLLPEVILVK